CTVYFNGWHENFSDPSEALDCFVFGLSDECRLKEHRRGNVAYRWTVESKKKWRMDRRERNWSVSVPILEMRGVCLSSKQPHFARQTAVLTTPSNKSLAVIRTPSKNVMATAQAKIFRTSLLDEFRAILSFFAGGLLSGFVFAWVISRPSLRQF